MDVLTTHQTAKLLGVSLPTVINWISEGRLEAYRTPGGHRRIMPGKLREFCEAYALPVPASLGAVVAPPTSKSTRASIIICSDESGISDVIQDFLQIARPNQTVIAETPLEAGYALGRSTGGVVLIDTANFDAAPNDFVEIMDDQFALVVLSSSPEESVVFTGEADTVFILSKPLEIETLGKTVDSALRGLEDRSRA